jgi:hypothetical protein
LLITAGFLLPIFSCRAVSARIIFSDLLPPVGTSSASQIRSRFPSLPPPCSRGSSFFSSLSFFSGTVLWDFDAALRWAASSLACRRVGEVRWVDGGYGMGIG